MTDEQTFPNLHVTTCCNNSPDDSKDTSTSQICEFFLFNVRLIHINTNFKNLNHYVKKILVNLIGIG